MAGLATLPLVRFSLAALAILLVTSKGGTLADAVD
jgi:hypothetical protein